MHTVLAPGVSHRRQLHAMGDPRGNRLTDIPGVRDHRERVRVRTVQAVAGHRCGGLTQFCFWVAIPALVFSVIAEQQIGALLNWPFVLVFGGVTSAVALLLFLGARFWKGMELGTATMFAMVSVVSNTGIIGLPLQHALFGKAAAVLATLAIMIVLIVVLVQVLVLETLMRDEGQAVSALGPLRHAVLNPVILSAILGVAVAVSPIELPKMVMNYLNVLGGAMAPCALFAVGMALDPGAIRRTGSVVAAATFVKLVALPALVLAVALILRFEPHMTVALVISAAVPTAKNEFILSEKYHQAEEITAETISATTAFAVVTLVLWLLVLSWIFPGAFSLSQGS